MKPVSIGLLNSPWVAGFMLPVEDTDVALAKLIRSLEGDDERGMFRPIPLEDAAAYRKALADALTQIADAHVENEARSIIRAGSGRHALRLVQKLTN
jgi:hypothetical protein